MSAAKILTCRFCGARVVFADGRYVCRHCRAEMRLDDHGDEVWQRAERTPRAFEGAANGAH